MRSLGFSIANFHRRLGRDDRFCGRRGRARTTLAPPDSSTRWQALHGDDGEIAYFFPAARIFAAPLAFAFVLAAPPSRASATAELTK